MGYNSIESITAGPRQSNFELLRIIAMFLVLIVHADFWSLNPPTLTDYTHHLGSSLVRSIIQCFSVICVNLFICISGWFGIRPTLKGLCNFIFQCVFIISLTYIVALIINEATFSLSGLKKCLLLSADLWFIKAYIGLYLISPILNKFIENSTKKDLSKILIWIFAFQTIFGLTDAAQFIMRGYSVFSFSCLYMLVRYIRLYGNRYFQLIKKLTFPALLFNSIIYISPFLFGIKSLGIILSYINPLVILASIGLTLLFGNLHIKPNYLINTISKSIFAVYLVHQSPFIGKHIFKSSIQKVYSEYCGFECLSKIFLIIIVFFLIGIILDQLRIVIWNMILKISHNEVRRSF